VQIDQVEVGSEAEFLAAELAISDDREARRALGMGMALLQLVPAEIHRRLHHDVGEFAEAVGEVLDGVHAGDVLRQEVENLRVVRFAQDVHFALNVVDVQV
jgi:hypothetical protein